MQKVNKIKSIKCNDGKELDIYTPQRHFVNVSENKKNGITIFVNEEKGEYIEVVVNGKKVYENYNEDILKRDKKLWPLLKSINWHTNSEQDIYFYNQYGRDILCLIEKDGNIRFRVDYIHIPNLKEVYPEITDDEILEFNKINRIINSICEENGYWFEFSHFMTNGFDYSCWNDIIVPKEESLNLDTLNYLFLLTNKVEDNINKIYNKYKK